MLISLDAVSTMDLALITCAALLSLMCGALAFRLKQVQQDELSDHRKTPEADENTKQQHYGVDLKDELKKLKDQLRTSQAQTQEAREEAELTLLQLHQVQEELEYYFLLSREQSTLLDTHANHQKRVQKLLKTSYKRKIHSQDAETAES